MKRILAAIACTTLLAATAARADAYDYVPEAPAGEAAAPINLCEHAAVREVARIDRELAPLKEIYGIATNPTGYAIKVVSAQAGIKVPRWIGYAMDPQGAVRAKVMKEVRKELKRNVGLAHDCAAEIDAAAVPVEATPESDA